MGYVVIDLEFNRMDNITKYYPEIFEEYPEIKNIDIESEIIQIGAIKVDQYMKIEDELKVYIKPTIFPVLNPEITNITNITEEKLKDGISFEEGILKLKKFIGEDILCSWAKDDVAQIIINSHYHGFTDLKWLKKYLDIQEYVTKILGVKKSLSLKNALRRLNIKSDESLLHDALNDAYYTVLVFKQVYNSRVLKNYIVQDIYDMPAITIRNLDNIELDYGKLRSVCPKCNKPLRLEYKYMPARWRFISIGKCPKCHASILNEVIVKKTLHGNYKYSEIGSLLDPIEYSDYVYKLEKHFNNREEVL